MFVTSLPINGRQEAERQKCSLTRWKIAVVRGKQKEIIKHAQRSADTRRFLSEGYFSGAGPFSEKKIKFWLGTTERDAELLCSRREISLERRQLPRLPLV